ncbi:MAG: hypothetical protein QNJ98_17585 [Planctomycetota bacterium]|nr:hypothetical protein [Planctomycetota bacterium]
MSTDPESPVTTFILVPEKELGHAIAKKLREDDRVQVCGISTDPDKDLFRIWEANPDVIVGDWEAGGLEFVFTERLPPGKHRIVFFAPRSEGGCDACYEALVHGAEGVMCRPASAIEVEHCDDLIESIRKGMPMRPADCPAVQRLERERAGGE